LVTEKAVKHDEAGAPTHLWDQQCTLVFPHVSLALNKLRRILLRVASRNMIVEFCTYLVETYSADWLSLLHSGRDMAAHRLSSRKQKRTMGVKEIETEEHNLVHDELLKDVLAGTDEIARFADSDWWSWKQGSALFFWRWPKGEQHCFARDGIPPWIKIRLPRYTRRPRPPDPNRKPLVLKKLQIIIDRGYVVAPEDSSFIKSLMDYFDVEKGSDI
jgi:hypothetical protein